MFFSTRNAFYLRVSNYRVVPLFLYLDERHVDWMSDRVLQHVMADMQPEMQELLLEGRFAKKHKVYVERGDTYQYCYFLRTTTRTEVVLLKQKSYSLRRPTPPPTPLPESPSPRKSGRKRPRSRSITAASEASRDGSPPLIGLNEDSVETEDIKPDIIVDEEDETAIKDWKPDVSLSYKGFGTSSVQLVLIIEPWPPLPASEYAPPSSRLSSRSASVMSSRSRSRTGTRATGARYSSVSLSVDPSSGSGLSNTPGPNMRNMRNATRSVTATPGPSGTRGSSSTPFGRENSTTPGGNGGSAGRGRTPLFIPRDTPFGDDEDDEDEHQAYTDALRIGRVRLPSISRPAGPELSAVQTKRSKRSERSSLPPRDEDEELDDAPDGIMEIGQRLVRSSEIEEGVVRVQGGWEERAEGEESAVMGKEEPGD